MDLFNSSIEYLIYLKSSDGGPTQPKYVVVKWSNKID
jgi:hypothetical protein